MLALLRVGPVAREAAVGEDRPHVAVVAQRGRASAARRVRIRRPRRTGRREATTARRESDEENAAREAHAERVHHPTRLRGDS